MFEYIKNTDPEIYAAMVKEMDRQKNKIELIASENFASRAVMEAMGSILTNKYAEGYPGKRYYGGCEFVDQIETLAIERAKKLFKAEHVNVQPHSGSQANMAVYFAMLQPGDTVMGMNLAHGGHLTHGSPVNFSGKTYRFVPYGVGKYGYIDYNEVESIALRERPKMIVAGASAYPRIIDFQKFREIADKVGAYLMVDMAHIAGLVAADCHPSPIPYADFVTTTTHKTLRGPRGGMIFCRDEYAKKIDSAIFPGIQGGPLEHIIAAKAICLKEAMEDSFKSYQYKTILNAKNLAVELNNRGFDIVSGGTDNHLLLIDLQNIGVTGKDAEKVLDKAGITVNKNGIPFDPLPPNITSGLRLGTPAVTTRGFGYPDMIEISFLIFDLLIRKAHSLTHNSNKVKELCRKHPLYK